MDIERDRYLFMSRTPGDEAHGPPPPTSILFRTMSAPLELDPAGHGLLWHSDPEIRVEDLLRRFSRLGPHRTLDESRSKRPLLCAIGRGPEGVVLRSREIAGGEDLDRRLRGAGRGSGVAGPRLYSITTTQASSTANLGIT